jgi:hypothetical protein
MTALAVQLVLAHAGHVLIDLPIFLGPVVVIVMWLKIANWRDKRSAARRGSPEGGRGTRDGRA